MRIILLFLLAPFISCKMDAPDRTDDEGKVYLSAQLGGLSTRDTTTTVYVKTTLHNNTNDTVMYLRMTCSWRDAFTTDNDSFRVLYVPCYSNGPIRIKIPPHQSEDEYLEMTSSINPYTILQQRFRVGFNFVPYDTTKDTEYNFHRMFTAKNILWSDTLKLNVFWKN